jgi:hypothetical protein
MNYEKGLSRLRQHLVKYADSIALSQLDLLEKQLSNSLTQLDSHPKDDIALSALNRALAGLDRLSWRMLAISFADLCKPPSNLGKQLTIPIRGMMILVLMVLLLPAVGISATVAMKGQSQLSQVIGIREEIQEVDKRINQKVSSPYYLSPKPADPCNESTLSKIVPLDDFIINIYLGVQALCIWEYYDLDSGKVIAKDYWDFFHQLSMREYYKDCLPNKDCVPIARDNFDFRRYDCAKERYFVDAKLRECYSETGKLLSIDPQQIRFSPIPPMIYWFFYR